MLQREFSSLPLHSEVYSSYKSHTTFKIMIGIAPNGEGRMKELAWLDNQTKLYRRLPHGCNTKWKDAVRTTNSQPTDISCLCLASVTKKAYCQICICTELLTVRLKVSSIGCAVPVVSSRPPVGNDVSSALFTWFFKVVSFVTNIIELTSLIIALIKTNWCL